MPTLMLVINNYHLSDERKSYVICIYEKIPNLFCFHSNTYISQYVTITCVTFSLETLTSIYLKIYTISRNINLMKYL